MRKPTLRRAAVIAAAGLALVAGGGAAVAATQSGDDREAFLGDVAERLGVQQSALEDAIEGASKARVDAAVADGRLTEEQAKAIKEHIEEGDGPMLGGPILGFRGPGDGHHHAHVELRAVHQAAARYLGMTERALMTAQRDGTSLADLAEKRSKPVAGLKSAMTAAAEKALAKAVTDGGLTDAQRDELLEGFTERLDDMIENGPMRFRGGHGPFPGGAALREDSEGAIFVPGPVEVVRARWGGPVL